MSTSPPPMDDDRKRKLANDCWKRGSEASLKTNWDYAIQMFRQSVNLVPGNLVYRQNLRGCEERKYDNNGLGAKMAGMRLMTTRGMLKKCKMQKQWPAVEKLCEDGLEINPWDAQLNSDLGDALHEQGHDEVAIYCYERSLKSDPNSKKVNRALAELLEDRGEFERAITCYKRILKIDPYDTGAQGRMRGIEAKSTLERGGYEQAKDSRFGMMDHEVAKILKTNQAADGPGMSVEADLLRAIRKEPANKDNYLKLADFFKRGGQIEQAEDQLRKALEVSGGDVQIREALEDVEIERMKKAINITKDKANAAPDDEEKAQRVRDMETELRHRQIEILARRVERYPAHMRYKFDLAQLYVLEGKYQLAIPLFQTARTDVRLKGEALVFLGRCFMADKNYTLARRQFQQAIPEIKHDDKPELYKQMYYYLGRCCEQLGDKDGAISAYQEVLAVDYSFADTQKRLQALESGET